MLAERASEAWEGVRIEPGTGDDSLAELIDFCRAELTLDPNLARGAEEEENTEAREVTLGKFLFFFVSG